MNEKNKKASTVGGVIFIGCMFVGMGMGFYFGQLLPGIFIGMGVGFIAMGIVWALMRS